MHIVAGRFQSRAEADEAFRDLNMRGFAPASMHVIERDDRKGFGRQHKSTLVAARQGAAGGFVAGAVVFGILLWITGMHLLTLYLSGVALFTAGGAAVLAFWNMGVSHDEALLYEEALATGAVIAAIEVDEPKEEQVIHALEEHGARDVQAGWWPPEGWTHAHPAYN